MKTSESEITSKSETLVSELFLRILGHELKAPLNVVDGYVDMLRSAALGDQLATYQPLLERCSVRLAGMRELITQVIALSRLETEGASDSTVFAESAESLSLSTLIETIVADQQEAAAAANVRLEIRIADDFSNSPTCELTAPRWAMETMLRNLLSNAIKYNRSGGTVHVELRQTVSWLEIEVRDTGLGMRAEDVVRLFGAFVRIQTPQTEQIAGNGLGLWMVKRLATLCHGVIAVQSEPGVGSVFTLRWAIPMEPKTT
ncbi:MAG: HAMP domain-containing sensor histidine kinase [Thermoguttaceae bacterium]|nr:HAMP domain-containing sensor histidine kinase [Thermoguttaceae bacterium]